MTSLYQAGMTVYERKQTIAPNMGTQKFKGHIQHSKHTKQVQNKFKTSYV